MLNVLPERLAATVKSYKADADAFPWQRVKNQRRTLVSLFCTCIIVDDAGYGADSARDVAGFDYCERLLRLTLASFRTQNFTNKVYRNAIVING